MFFLLLQSIITSFRCGDGRWVSDCVWEVIPGFCCSRAEGSSAKICVQQNIWRCWCFNHFQELPPYSVTYKIHYLQTDKPSVVSLVVRGPLRYVVEADKGFNYLSYDDSFVCQKKNHFQITATVGLTPGSAEPRFVLDSHSGTVVPVEGFYLHFHGIKVHTFKLWNRLLWKLKG